MRILVDLNHPHQVHLFRNIILHWIERGDDVQITARNKDVTVELLQSYRLSYSLSGMQRKPTLLNFVRGVLESDEQVYRLAKRFDPDFLIGTSFAAAHVSKFVRGLSVVFAEDSFSSSPMFWRITAPFADYVVTPSVIRDTLSKKHVRYESYQELAYLHPNQFVLDRDILKKYNIDTTAPLFLMRFVSFMASHDTKQHGFDYKTKLDLAHYLSSIGQLFISTESDIEPGLREFKLSIEPRDIHHVLAASSLLVSDSQSMSVEAAVLGVPSIRSNTLAHSIPVLEELEHRYGLTFSFLPEKKARTMDKVSEIIDNHLSAPYWEAKRNRLLSEKIDLTKWMIGFFQNLYAFGQ